MSLCAHPLPASDPSSAAMSEQQIQTLTRRLHPRIVAFVGVESLVVLDEIILRRGPKYITTERQTIEGSCSCKLLQAIASYYKLLHSCHQYSKFVGLSYDLFLKSIWMSFLRPVLKIRRTLVRSFSEKQITPFIIYYWLCSTCICCFLFTCWIYTILLALCRGLKKCWLLIKNGTSKFARRCFCKATTSTRIYLQTLLSGPSPITQGVEDHKGIPFHSEWSSYRSVQG